MEAPNKIYLYGLSCFATVPVGKNGTEYIRKDALLEWARQTRGELEKQNAIKDDIRKGAIYQLEELVDKLDSM